MCYGWFWVQGMLILGTCEGTLDVFWVVLGGGSSQKLCLLFMFGPNLTKQIRLLLASLKSQISNHACFRVSHIFRQMHVQTCTYWTLKGLFLFPITFIHVQNPLSPCLSVSFSLSLSESLSLSLSFSLSLPVSFIFTVPPSLIFCCNFVVTAVLSSLSPWDNRTGSLGVKH